MNKWASRTNVRTDIAKIKSSDTTFYSAVLLPLVFKAVPNLNYYKHAAMNILTCGPKFP